MQLMVSRWTGRRWSGSRVLVNIMAQFLELDEADVDTLTADPDAVQISHESRFNKLACCKQEDVVLFDLDGPLFDKLHSAARNHGVVLATAATIKSLQLKLLEKMDVVRDERAAVLPSLAGKQSSTKVIEKD